MRWRALAVAMAGLSVWLGACSFDDAWRAYCDYEGRCSMLDAGPGLTLIAQGTPSRTFVLPGHYLSDASVTVAPGDAGTVLEYTVLPDQVTVTVAVFHGAEIGSRFRLHLQWKRENEFADSDPFEVTPLTVAMNGDDDGGYGTPDRPFRTLARASQWSGANDTIQVGPGSYASIYPTQGGPCDTTSGLKAGVTVQGESPDASVINGNNQPGCAFNLFSGDQQVRQLTITGFAEGLRASDAGTGSPGRPAASQVVISSCTAGVAAQPGSSLLLSQAVLRSNGVGLALTSGDVVMQGGEVASSTGNGVQMLGEGGSLVLDGVDVHNNAETRLAPADDLAGAGVLIGADGGTAALRATVNNNGRTGVTIAGTSNRVTIDGANLQANLGAYALLVRDRSDAGVFLRNTSMLNASTCIRVEDVSFFNGGTGDGGNGGNSLGCLSGGSGLEIWDARGSTGAPLDFERTSLDGFTPDAGTSITSTTTTLGIQIDHPGNSVRFH